MERAIAAWRTRPISVHRRRAHPVVRRPAGASSRATRAAPSWPQPPSRQGSPRRDAEELDRWIRVTGSASTKATRPRSNRGAARARPERTPPLGIHARSRLQLGWPAGRERRCVLTPRATVKRARGEGSAVEFLERSGYRVVARTRGCRRRGDAICLDATCWFSSRSTARYRGLRSGHRRRGSQEALAFEPSRPITPRSSHRRSIRFDVVAIDVIASRCIETRFSDFNDRRRFEGSGLRRSVTPWDRSPGAIPTSARHLRRPGPRAGGGGGRVQRRVPLCRLVYVCIGLAYTELAAPIGRRRRTVLRHARAGDFFGFVAAGRAADFTIDVTLFA